MKVLIVGNGHLTKTGVQYSLHREIASFVSDCVSFGMNVSYASCVTESVTLNLSNSLFPDHVHVEEIPSLSHLPLHKKLLSFPSFVYFFILLIRRYDFFYCFYPGNVSSLVVLLAILFRKKYGLYVRGELFPSKFTQFILKHASFILAVGSSIVSKICPDYQNCRDVVPMSNVFQSDTSTFLKDSFRSPLRGVFVGRVSKEKGCFDLLLAMKILRDKSIPVVMNFVGTYMPDFEEEVKSMHLEDCVTLSGLAKGADELRRHYEAADFFCLPTWTEGFPRVLYEAMSHGLPCITTMVGGIPSRMHAGENCLAINVRDPKSICDAIMTFVRYPEKMKMLSLASIKTFQYWKLFFEGQTHAKQLLKEINQLNS